MPEPTSPSSLDHVAILGLGICGSLTAIALLQRTSIPRVTIYELRSGPATIGGALNVSPNANRVLSSLNVPPTLYGGATPWVLFQNETGTKVGEFKYGGKGDPHAQGYEGMRVVRNDLQDDLIRELKVWEATGRLQIVFSKKANRIDEFDSSDVENKEGAIITFDDGETVHADLVVGGDGIHSFTRAQICAQSNTPTPKATYSGVTTIYGLVPSSLIPASVRAPLESHQSIRTISPHAGLFAISYATANKSHIHWFSSRSPPTPPSSERADPNPEAVRAELIDTYGSFPEPIPSLIRATENIYYWPVYRLNPMPAEWFSPKGKMVVVGDAAHAMPPHAAQGVGMGVEDAVVVAKIIAAVSKSQSTRITANLWRREYQQRRMPRVKHYTEHAEAMGRARMDNGYVQGKLREWGMWLAFPIINFIGNGLGGMLVRAVGSAILDIQGWGYDPNDEVINLEGL